MIKRGKNESGFGTVEILVAVAVVVVLAIVGGAVYNNHKNTVKRNAINASANTSKTSAANPLSSNTQTAQTQQQSLPIKEWNIQIPLSTPIQDAYYVVSTSSHASDGSPNTMWLGLTSLNSSGCNAASANQGQSTQLGAILRVLPTDTDPVSGTAYKDLYPNGTTIGSYYFAYKSYTKGKTCTSQSNLQSIDSAFASAVKGATATN